MNKKVYENYLETSVYTDVGIYKEFILSLPDDISSGSDNINSLYMPTSV